jgi:hypothetical protein
MVRPFLRILDAILHFVLPKLFANVLDAFRTVSFPVASLHLGEVVVDSLRYVRFDLHLVGQRLSYDGLIWSRVFAVLFDDRYDICRAVALVALGRAWICALFHALRWSTTVGACAMFLDSLQNLFTAAAHVALLEVAWIFASSHALRGTRTVAVLFDDLYGICRAGALVAIVRAWI